MKSQKDLEKPIWDQMRSPSGNPIPGTGSSIRPAPKLMVWLILFVSVTYVVYTLKLVSTSRACDGEREPFSTTHRLSSTSTSVTSNITSEPSVQNQADAHRHIHKHESQELRVQRATEIHHIVFGIAASAKLWNQRKEYIKIWYQPNDMRGVVWLDDSVKSNETDNLPPVKISSDTSQFPYKNNKDIVQPYGSRASNVRWFVMGDDDTVFITENLVRVLRKYDHNQYYYIGSLSESHLQNIYFSYGMAYGGGGFAISYPLAKALVKMQDRCIHRYPGLYGSDDRMQACMAELGVPLTKEFGFHQYDVYGNLFGLLAAHPVTPLVSLHHLDVVEPIFPNMTRVQALQHLMVPKKLDSAALMQQSICYDKRRTWTISVSWGFAVQIFRGIFSPREMEMPSRTFLNWYRRADYTAYAFNTRPVSRNHCQKPFVFYMSKAEFNSTMNQTVSEYARHRIPHPQCRWKMANPAELDTLVIYKKPDPYLWDRSPRRNCCRVLKSKKKGVMEIDVGVCRPGEVSEV
ncbi:hypothetical protein CISIN_1g037480mg [Citrus sinensis]|uniref:Uncharacterized protein n=1 Tax=Citrus sinensis TaxID=2711 RepID=A0A067GLV8_CITSI|nr:hypothetical protein CISIN_1g037480mg [Citrus sinensis]